jgi:ubiquinone/menaquinone biosynthesis C-methylase UbiE
LLSRSSLLNILAPSPGERLLEVGPGTGYYSLDVAQHIEPGGTLDILDLQEAMLTTTIAKARERRIDNLIPTPGSAQTLPYPDASFDGAFLVAVLGEVPDKNAALLELRRVLKRGGRLVVGEGQPDPHMVGFAELVERATRGGFQFEERSGGRLGYVACFRAV